MWHRIAKRLYCTPREAKGRVNSAEFAEYVEVFRQEDKDKFDKREKWEHYASLIASEIRRSWVTEKGNVKDDGFLLSWVSSTPEDKPKAPEQSPEEKAATRLAIDKYTWGIISGKLIPVKKRKPIKRGSNSHPPKSSR